MIQRLLSKIIYYLNRRSNETYIKYLRSNGISIGIDCIFRDVLSTRIDLTRPSLVSIGNNVDMNRNFELLTHDWGSYVFIRMFNDFIPAHKRVQIGSNIYFGTNCVVLAGAKIGDNCIIGANSLVNKEIPANSVAAGIPARVICSIDEYYERRKKLYIEEIIDYAKSIRERFHREPTIEDFYDDYPAFVDGSNCDEFDYPYQRIFNDEQFNIWKQSHKAHFKNFEELLEASRIELKK